MKHSGIERLARLVLDTSAYARMRAGHKNVLKWIAAAENIFLPAPVIGELQAGFLMGRRTRENRVVLDEFLAEPFVSTIDVTPLTAQRYAQILVQLRQTGTPIPTNDLWIAAATVDCGGTLLTVDRHFERISGLDYRRVEAGDPN